jgi:hypothetical protein
MQDYFNSPDNFLGVPIRTFGQGEFEDADSIWYDQVGAQLFQQTLIFTVSSNIIQILYGMYATWAREGEGWKRIETQPEMDDFYALADFDFALRLAQNTGIMMVILLWTSGMPLMWWLGAASMCMAYFVDKYILLRHSRRPPDYSARSMYASEREVYSAITAHTIASLVILGNQDTFPSHKSNINIGFSQVLRLFIDNVVLPGVCFDRDSELTPTVDVMYTKFQELEENARKWGSKTLMNCDDVNFNTGNMTAKCLSMKCPKDGSSYAATFYIYRFLDTERIAVVLQWIPITFSVISFVFGIGLFLLGSAAYKQLVKGIGVLLPWFSRLGSVHGSDYTYKELLESGSGDGLSAEGKLVSYRMGANREYRKETMAMVDLETRSKSGNGDLANSSPFQKWDTPGGVEEAMKEKLHKIGHRSTRSGHSKSVKGRFTNEWPSDERNLTEAEGHDVDWPDAAAGSHTGCRVSSVTI